MPSFISRCSQVEEFIIPKAFQMEDWNATRNLFKLHASFWSNGSRDKPVKLNPLNPTPPSFATNTSAAKTLLLMHSTDAAAPALTHLRTYGPPSPSDAQALWDTTDQQNPTHLYCHGRFWQQTPAKRARAYYRNLSPGAREGLVLWSAERPRPDVLRAEELRGKGGCGRCERLRERVHDDEDEGDATEDEGEAAGHVFAAPLLAAPILPALASEEAAPPVSNSRKRKSPPVRVNKAPRKRSRNGEMAGLKDEVMEEGARDGVMKSTRRKRTVKAPTRFGE